MKKIRVLIVDDSVLMRLVLTDLISRDSDIDVIATAINAKVAFEKIERLSPDIVVLDIEMPEMDGLTALKVIKKEHPNLPVIMCSALTRHGGKTTLEALALGADDYIVKPVNCKSREEMSKAFGGELIYKIKGLVPHIKSREASINLGDQPGHRIIQHTKTRVDIVAIGTSTGGPNALSAVLPQIPADFPIPIVIVQHMPPVFTNILADSLSSKCLIPVKEAKDGDVLSPGHAWIAPGNHHMTIKSQNNHHIIQLNQEPPENFCRPSVDVLFRSVATLFEEHTLAIVMTGMGHDGLNGCQMIKKHKGQILAQDEASSVVWGMPKAITESGLADEILPLDNIGLAIVRRVNRK